MSQNQHFYGEFSNYPRRLIKALSFAQMVVAVVAIVPHFCILAMDKIAFKDVGAGIWSCIGYMAAGTLGLGLSMRPRVSRLQIGKFYSYAPCKLIT